VSAPSTIAPELREIFANFKLRTAEEEAAERLEHNRTEIALKVRDLMQYIERWIHPQNEKFRGIVRDPRLRKIAECYELLCGPLCISGPAGVGKTITVQAMLRHLITRAYRVGDLDDPILTAKFFTATEIAREQRETRLGREAELLDDARFARVLVLDELGQESADPRWLLELLDFRQKKRRVTLTTTGLTRAELLQRYGAGAFRRLYEPGGAFLDLFSAGGTSGT
jgi:DNA replication protein DnaC